MGLTEGNIFQGELSLEQLFFLRPVPGWADYRTPIDGLLHVRIGDASGRRHHGRAGPQRRARRPQREDQVSRPVIIGGGHNGLVAAAYLARAGRKPLVLERRDEVGGAAVTHELAPGFRVPALAHAAALRADVVSELDLERQGLHFTRPAVSVFAPAGDRALVLWREMLQSVQSLAHWSAADAARWPEFSETALAIAGAVGGLLRQVPPSLDEPVPASCGIWRPPVARFAASAGRGCISCCGGGRCRSPISQPSGWNRRSHAR